MSKILLINPGHDNEHEIYKHISHRRIHRDPPPIALLYIGTYLVENGYKVEIIDTHIEEDYIKLINEKVKENHYLFAGITVVIGKFLKNAKEITNLIRRINPELPIVWGGIMPSILPEACLIEYKPDFIVRFEGEETCLELANALEAKLSPEDIKGISFMENGKVRHNPSRLPKLNLDEYPIPKWELFGKYFNKEQIPYYFMIMSSKGCLFNCRFCYKHSFDTEIKTKVPEWRYRSSKHIIAEIDYIHQKTGTTVFTFGDDNFLANKKRAFEILDYFRVNGFYIEECGGHLNCLDEDLINAMGGIVQTFAFSVETASIKLQEYINKKLDLESIPDKVKKLYDKGITSTITFIVGFPPEANKDLRRNIDLMLKLKTINPFARGNTYFFLPLPKTELFYEIENTFNIKLPININDLENANFWIRSSDDAVGRKFRPWLCENRFKFLIHYGYIFNDAFKLNNSKLNSNTIELLKNDTELSDMFKGIEFANHPKTEYLPYILDMVLNGAKLDLINSLKWK